MNEMRRLRATMMRSRSRPHVRQRRWCFRRIITLIRPSITSILGL